MGGNMHGGGAGNNIWDISVPALFAVNLKLLLKKDSLFF